MAGRLVVGKVVWAVGSTLGGGRSTDGEQWTRVLGGPLRGSRLAAPLRERPSFVLGRYEPHVIREFQHHLRPGTVAYDIGAHIGYCTLVMSKYVSGSGTVIAIEADARNCALLRTNIATNGRHNVHVVESAVGERTGTIEFASFDGCSTVGRIRTDATPSDAVVSTVPVTTIDDMVLNGHLPPRFIKIDVEGAETGVIAGALGVLAEHKPAIVAELRVGSTLEEVHDLLAPLGYSSRTLNPSSGNAGDGVMDVLFTVGTPAT